jgi:hypothetical protein
MNCTIVGFGWAKDIVPSGTSFDEIIVYSAKGEEKPDIGDSIVPLELPGLEYVEGINDTLPGDDSWITDPNNEGAIEYYPSVSYELKGIELWTGESSGILTIKVYDTIADLPGNQLNIATITLTPEKLWYGVEFATGTPLIAGNRYWISSECTTSYQTNTAGDGVPGAVEPIYYWRPHGEPGWSNGPFQGLAFMFKFYEPEFVGAELIISPPSGDYVTTQKFDLTFIVEADDLFVIGVNNATIDDIDITNFLDKRGIPGTLMTGGETFRVRSFSRFLKRRFGVGTHTLNVTLDLSDGSNVSNAVTWEVKENTEP